MPKTSEKVITIHSILRTRKRLKIVYDKGSERLSIDTDENALPAFHSALDAMPALICHILEVPEAWATGVRPMGLVMGEQGEADTVSILGQKSLSESAKAFKITTPPRLLAHPTEPGTYTPPLKNEWAELVWELIEAAKDFVKGNRAQGVLPGLGGDDEDDEEENGGGDGEGSNVEQLPGTEVAAAVKAKKPKKKKK